MNKPVYLGLVMSSLLRSCKIVMYEIWYDYRNENMAKQNYVTWMQAVL